MKKILLAVLLKLGIEISIIKKQLKKIMTNSEKAIQDLSEIQGTLQKVGNESAATLQKVTELEAAAANADTPQSVLDKIAEVKAQAKVVDDLVPDAVDPVDPQNS